MADTSGLKTVKEDIVEYLMESIYHQLKYVQFDERTIIEQGEGWGEVVLRLEAVTTREMVDESYGEGTFDDLLKESKERGE